MKRRFSLFVMAIPLVLTTVTWMVARKPDTTIQIVTAPAPLAAVSTQPSLDQPAPSVSGELPASIEPVSPILPIAESPAQPTAEPAREPQRQVKEVPVVAEIAPSKPVSPKVASVKPIKQKPLPPERVTEVNYIAAVGDTVSNMAGAFLGGDDKVNKDAIINANASLQADPDRVVVGKVYRIPIPAGLSGSADSAKAQPARPMIQPDADDLVLAGSPRALRYTARPGDTLTSMSLALLGDDTLATLTAIRNHNPLLKANPDRIVVGHTYWIPAPDAASATSDTR